MCFLHGGLSLLCVGYAVLQRLVGGYMTKRGKEVKSWKSRWWALVGDSLCYYTDESVRDVVPANLLLMLSRSIDVWLDEC